MTEQIFDISSSELVKEFPNGFYSWADTNAEICIAIGEKLALGDVTSQMDEILGDHGRKGLWDLAGQLTDQFEAKYKDVAWDVDDDPETGKEYDYYDAIDKFLNENL